LFVFFHKPCEIERATEFRKARAWLFASGLVCALLTHGTAESRKTNANVVLVIEDADPSTDARATTVFSFSSMKVPRGSTESEMSHKGVEAQVEMEGGLVWALVRCGTAGSRKIYASVVVVISDADLLMDALATTVFSFSWTKAS
jgi:hypothetical protein